MPIEIVIDPLEVRCSNGSFGGPHPSLDLQMLRMVARGGPLSSTELSERLWPGVPERWRLERLSELRAQLTRRLGERALIAGAGGWQLSKACRVMEGKAGWGPEKPGGGTGDLLEALREGPRSTAELAKGWGISQAAVRKRAHQARKVLPEGALISGGGGYQLSALVEPRSPGRPRNPGRPA